MDGRQPGTRHTYSIEEAAAMLGISRTTAYESARRGDLPALRFGRRLVVTRTTIEQLLGTPNADSLHTTPRERHPRRYRWVRVRDGAQLRSLPGEERPRRRAV